MGKYDTTDGSFAVVDGVIHTLEPPHTGSQKCDGCGGWICSAVSYIDKGKRYCRICWGLIIDEIEEKIGNVLIEKAPAEITDPSEDVRDCIDLIEDCADMLDSDEIKEFAKDIILRIRQGILGEEEDDDIIEDGFGSEWSAWCPVCGRKSMSVVRPGKVQCNYCG